MRWIMLSVALGFTALGLAACGRQGNQRLTASPAASGPAGIVGVEWELVELGGAPAPVGQGGRRATLLLADSGGRVSGFAGCNRMAGHYELDGETLRFGPMVLTRMACAEGMGLENRFRAALETVRGYRTITDGLELLDERKSIARFRRPSAGPGRAPY